MKYRIIFLVLMFSFLISLNVSAHRGRTNANGCHTKHSDGSYHCHNTRKIYQSKKKTYCLNKDNIERCGYALSSCKKLKKKFGGYCSREK